MKYINFFISHFQCRSYNGLRQFDNMSVYTPDNVTYQ